MEKRLMSGSCATLANKDSENSSNTNVIKTFKPEKDIVMVKRPFLRKNEGRAAWCSRLRSSNKKVNTTSENSSKLSVKSIGNRNRSPEYFQSLANKPILKKMENASHPFVKIYSCDSTIDGLSAIRPSDSFPHNNEKVLNVDEKNCLNVTGDEKELVEFEMLERLAENHHNNISQQDLADKCQSTCDSAKQSNAADVLLNNSNQMSISDNTEEGSDRYTGEICLASRRGNRKTLSRACSAKPRLSTIESSSLEFDDLEPWDDEVDVDSSTSSKKATPCRHQSLPSVRFDIPDDRTDSNFGNENCVEMPSNLESPDKSLFSVKAWIARLEAEVSRFNTETAALMKLRTEKEEGLLALDKEKKEFKEYKETTMKEFEAFRQDEICKLKRERKVLSDYQRSLHSMPQKRDREEIERLKQQISDEKAEAAQRETRLQQQLNRQRLRIDELTNEKTELLERIKRLEQARLAMQNVIAEERSNRSLNGRDKLHRNASLFKSQNQIDCITQNIPFPKYNGKLPNLLDIERQELKSTRTASAGSISYRSAVAKSQLPSSKSMNGDINFQDPSSDPLPTRPSSGTITKCCNGSGTITTRTPPSSRALPERNRGPVLREVHHPDGSLERLYCDGSRTIDYANGSTKEIFPDGVSSIVCLFNGDTKQTKKDGTVIYRYAADGTVQTTTPAGIEEIMYKDGRREVNYPRERMPASNPPISPPQIPLTSSNPSQRKNSNSCNATFRPEVVEESHFPDGMSVQIFSNGDKVISLPNGQRELHCSEFKRRTYPDGTVKTVFSDGHQETHYASGRVRIKDSEGNLLMDTRIAPVSQNAAAGLASFLSSASHLPTPR
ncbi:hypothetical protein Aperf_G00000023868 [Anoplocephala perfoliata]